MAQKPTLGYWYIRGVAEGIRYLLDYLGVDFEDKTYLQGPGPDFDKSAWTNAIEGLGMSFPNLPHYIDGDLKISETLTIFQYIASKYGPDLAGHTLEQIAEINQIGGAIHDVKWWLSGQCYDPTFLSRKDSVVQDCRDEVARLGKFLGEKKFLLGDQIIWPDFIFFELLEMLNALSPGTVLSAGENLENYRARMAALPQLQRRITAPRLPWNNTQAAWL
jgi:glutathione S-transferase